MSSISGEEVECFIVDRKNRGFFEKIERIRTDVDKLIQIRGAQPFNPYFTAHGIPHIRNVMRYAGFFINALKHTSAKLNDDEVFVLSAAVWLHDVGMMVAKDNEDENVTRKLHNIRSYEYIIRNHQDLGLSQGDLYIPVARVAKAHRDIDLEDDKYNNYTCFKDPIRLRLLSAILRIADALDVGNARAPDEVREKLSMSFTKENEFHWIKHKYVSCTTSKIQESEQGQICLQLNIITHIPTEEYSKRIIEPYVIAPIKEELKGVEYLFNQNGLFLEIKEINSIDDEITSCLSEEQWDIFEKFKVNIFRSSEEGHATDLFLGKLGFNEDEQSIILFTVWNGKPIWETEASDIYSKFQIKQISEYMNISRDGINKALEVLNSKDADLVIKNGPKLNIKILCNLIVKSTWNNFSKSLEEYVQINKEIKVFIDKLFDMVYYLPVEAVMADPFDPKYRADKILKHANEELQIKELRVQAYSYKENMNEICPTLLKLAEQKTTMYFLLYNPILSPHIRKPEDMYEITKNAKKIIDLQRETLNKKIFVRFYDGKKRAEELLFRGHIIDKRIITFAIWPFQIEKTANRIKIINEKSDRPKLGDPRHGAKIAFLEGRETNILLMYLGYFNKIWKNAKLSYENLEDLIKLYLSNGENINRLITEHDALAKRWSLGNDLCINNLKFIVEEMKKDSLFWRDDFGAYFS
jgi:hypothetical protein